LAIKEYFLPESLDEATALLAEHGPTLLVMAGGTLAMPLINDGISMPKKVMGLRHADLDTVISSNGAVTIGATATFTRMLALKTIPLLQQAARHIGGWQIRNMGTVGGNLFAPPPAGDFAAALLALDARVKLSDSDGHRLLPLSELYTGFMTTALAPGELVTELQVPIPQGKTAFSKLGRKQANTPAVVSVAAHITVDGNNVKDARIALNAVGPHPIRATQAEAALLGSPFDKKAIAAAAAAASEECEPFTDANASEWYRRKMTDVVVRRTLAQIAGQEKRT
jgi:CO/xanthine dehydrogenase FAD-binding subunit